MPDSVTPGVFVDDRGSGPRPIEGVGTSTAAFVGVTERGPILPRVVTGWLDYQQRFGGLVPPAVSYLPWAVRGFFENGGRGCSWRGWSARARHRRAWCWTARRR